MKTIQVRFPDNLYHLLRSVSMDTEKFIIASVKKNLQEIKTVNMELMLIEGYKATRKAAQKITKDFESIDLENLQKSKELSKYT